MASLRGRKRPVISCGECHRRKQKCDRHQPCHHCIKRDRPDLCYYETTVLGNACVEAKSQLASHDARVGLSGNTGLASDPSGIPSASNTSTPFPNIQTSVSGNLGYAENTTGTLGILQAVVDLEDVMPRSESTPKLDDDASRRYYTLAEKLPSKSQMEWLISAFFENVGWRYDIIDEHEFRTRNAAWDQASSSHAWKGQYLAHCAPENRLFPALLFQVLAQAILSLPAQYDYDRVDIDNPIRGSREDLISRAIKYSDFGHQILLALDKDYSMTMVQAFLLQASFQKTMGAVVEAWHSLGRAIRCAQEIGLHRLTPLQSIELALHQQQVRHVRTGSRLWLVLHLWDVHMAVVLGRPLLTKMSAEFVASNFAMDLCDGSSAPRPFSVILWGYHVAYKYLQDIPHLEPGVAGACDRADAIHSAILCNYANLPSFLKNQRHPHDQTCPWLPEAREALVTEIYFTIFALHRPFILLRSESRIECIKAALQVLESQSRLYSRSNPTVHAPFTLVFAVFDAMAIIAALFILFPRENEAYIGTSAQALDCGLERLRMLKRQSSLAASAHHAMAALVEKFKSRISAVFGLPKVMNGPTSEPTTVSAMVGPNIESIMPLARSNSAAQTAGDPLVSTTPDLRNFMPPLPLQELILRQGVANDASSYGEFVNPWLDHAREPVTDVDDGFWDIFNNLG